MNARVTYLGALISIVGVMSIGCGSDSSSPGAPSGSDSGAGGSAGSGSGSGGKGGNAQGGNAQGGNAQGGNAQGGNAQGGNAQGGNAQGGNAQGGNAQGGGGGSGAGTGGASTLDAGTGGASTMDAGTGGAGNSDASSGGTGNGGTGNSDAGTGGTGTGGGSQVDAGDGGSALVIARGAYLVRTVALCGGCHTAKGGQELAGNPLFKNGALPAPNLTPDPTGLGTWTNDQIANAIRNGVDDEGRHLDSAMPYWLFHNMSDADVGAIVAFLRSLPAVSTPNDSGTDNPDATPVTPLATADFPDTTLASTPDPDYATAEMGRYLLAGVAQCVKRHSPSSSGLPVQSYFSGAAPTNSTQIFASNITPDATGISGWTAADVATSLKSGLNKAGTLLCGSMPSAAKGYGGLTDADANAIGIYLTTIPAVSHAAADPSLEPACP